MRQTQMSGRDAYITGEIAKIVANGGGFLRLQMPSRSIRVMPIMTVSKIHSGDFLVTLTGTATSGGQADLYRANAYAINALESI